jgi:tetraacyldisaccharide-1-P 4'-kinase
LLAACDRVVRVGVGGGDVVTSRPVDTAPVRSDGAWLGPGLVPWTTLRGRRVGVWTALARPARILEALAREAVTPALHIRHADHAAPSPTDIAEAIELAWRARVDLWVATSKCVTHLPSALGGVPVATLAYELSLPEVLVDELRRAVLPDSASRP